MVDVIAPEIAPCVDALLAEYALQIAEGANAVLFPCTLADAEDDLLLVVEIDIGVVRRHIGKEALRRIVVERLIHPSLEEDVAVIDAGKRKASGEQVRSSKESEHSVIGAKAAACRHRQSSARSLQNKGH